MAVTVLQHLPHEGAGVVGEVLAAAGRLGRTVRLWAGEPVPDAAEVAGGLVVLGGDMDTDQDDTYPFLADERRLLSDVVPRGVPVLGICLGAQLLAEASGGAVAHADPEIGYVPVWRTPAGVEDPVLGGLPDGTPTFNAHRDVVAVAPDAVVLARSAATPVHAFRVERAWGVQFHPEFTADMVAGYVAAPGVEAYLQGAGWTGARLLAEARRHDAAHRAQGAALTRRWLDAVDA